MTLADYSKFMLCDKFRIQWLLPCMDVLECVINAIQYNTIGPPLKTRALQLDMHNAKHVITIIDNLFVMNSPLYLLNA
jgi:hypothetical protein